MSGLATQMVYFYGFPVSPLCFRLFGKFCNCRGNPFVLREMSHEVVNVSLPICQRYNAVLGYFSSPLHSFWLRSTALSYEYILQSSGLCASKRPTGFRTLHLIFSERWKFWLNGYSVCEKAAGIQAEHSMHFPRLLLCHYHPLCVFPIQAMKMKCHWHFSHSGILWGQHQSTNKRMEVSIQ